MAIYTILMPEIFGSHKFSEVQILDNISDLEILLEDETDAMLKVSFNSHLAYRKMDEGDAWSALADIKASSELGTKLYVVSDSEFLRWFHEESQNIHKSQSVAHYCLTTIDNVIDVIAFDPPMVVPA